MAGEGSSWSDVLIEEELIAHQWLRRFVIAAPIATAPLFLVPLHFWLANAPLGIFLKCLYVFLIIMTEWSYLKASFTSPGSIPSNWQADEGVTYIYPENETGQIPTRRQCEPCHRPKPPRTSHCKYCRRCVPKMDHHCAWTANCVGEKNHKYFVLFLFYMSQLAAVFTIVSLVRVVGMIVKANEEWHPVHLSPGQTLAVIAGLIFSTPTYIGVSSLFFSQLGVIFKNCTMLEKLSIRALKKYAKEVDEDWKFVQPYDQGAFRNFLSVFGPSPYLWLLPIANDNRREGEITAWPINENYMGPRPRKTV